MGQKEQEFVKLDLRKKPIFRLDNGPFKGTHGEPRLHGHLPTILPNKHIPLDPRSLFD